VKVAVTAVPVRTMAAAKREVNFIHKPTALYNAGITVLSSYRLGLHFKSSFACSPVIM